MSRRQQRIERKRRRRRKRLAKRSESGRRVAEGSRGSERLGEMIRRIDRAGRQESPGARDAALDFPDMIKAEMGELLLSGPGRSRLERLEKRFEQGVLGFLPDIKGWAMEEFLYRGIPGEDWNLIEEYLRREGDRFSPAGEEQLRQWKEAEIGIYEVGPVRGNLLELTEWDPIDGRRSGPTRQAITLNIGGVDAYRDLTGQITATYLAPWAPEQQIFCGMGYGITVPKEDAVPLIHFLGLRHPEVVSQPLPWKRGERTGRGLFKMWKRRNWYAWFEERLNFPFEALISLPPNGQLDIREVVRLVPTFKEKSEQFGVYFEVPLGRDVLAAGATSVRPIDVTSPNMKALLEYQAYRDLAGPPPGVASQPTFMEF